MMLLNYFLLFKVDHWLTLSQDIAAGNYQGNIQDLDETLNLSTYLVGHAVTIADLCVWGALYCRFNQLLSYHCYQHFLLFEKITPASTRKRLLKILFVGSTSSSLCRR
jgi:hypothetical protein